MSVILNALKKSEQERHAGRAPSAPAPAPSPPPARRTWPWLAAAGAALGVAVVVGAVLWRPASPPLVTEAKAPTASPARDSGASAGMLRTDDPTPAMRAATRRAPARPAWPVPMAAIAKQPRPPHHGAAPKPMTVAAREAAVPVRAVAAIAAPPQQSRPTLALSPSRPAAAPRRQIAALAAAAPAPLANVALAPRPRAPSPAPAATVADRGDQTPVTRATATPLIAAPRQTPVHPVQQAPAKVARSASDGRARLAVANRPEPSAEAAAPPGETVPPVAVARDAATPNMTAAPVVPVSVEPMAEAPRRLAALDRPVGPNETARRVPPATAAMPTEALATPAPLAAPAPLVEAAAPPPRLPNQPRPRPRNVLDPYATVPMLATLPRTFVSSVPRLALSLHVYDKEPANRLVRLNGNTYREGDVTADGMTLDAIVPNGLVLRYEGRQFRVRM